MTVSWLSLLLPTRAIDDTGAHDFPFCMDNSSVMPDDDATLASPPSGMPGRRIEQPEAWAE
jgi:hypothetical protein